MEKPCELSIANLSTSSCNWICDWHGAKFVLVAEMACKGLLAKKAASDRDCDWLMWLKCLEGGTAPFKRAPPPLLACALLLGCCGSGKWPDSGKSPKVVRRGCKRSFGTREQKSQKGLLNHQNLVLHRCNPAFHRCKRVCPDCTQRPFAPSPNHFGAISLNPVICQDHSFPTLIQVNLAQCARIMERRSGVRDAATSTSDGGVYSAWCSAEQRSTFKRVETHMWPCTAWIFAPKA